MSFGGMRKGFLTFGADTSSPHLQETSGDHGATGTSHACTSSEYQDDLVYLEHQILGPGLETEECAKAEKKCDKNPRHEKFISIDELTKEDLPEKYRNDEELMEYIKVTADLTVRLRVTATGSKRVEVYKTKKGSTCTGTGFVYRDVDKNRNPCQCSSCQTKPMDQRICWRLAIHTVQHVVLDDEESKKTRVDFFYDSKESLKDGRMKTVKGGEVISSYTDRDACILYLTTCDRELVEKVIKLQTRENELWTILKDRYGPNESNIFVWIVSHPHGLPKLVTFGGEIKDKQIDHDRRCYEYSYRVDTCPGSSGASVFPLRTLEKELDTSLVNFVTTPYHATVDKGQFLGCGQENEDSFKAELKCVKNPGQKAFIPICELTKEDLPKYFQDDKELLQFMKATADMTVRVRVCDTNPISPHEDNSKTGGGYTLTYTGFISGFNTEEGPCQCDKCKDKEEKSQTFREFHILLCGTDLGEESDSKTFWVDLFYDSEESCTDGRMKTFECENLNSRVLKRLNHRLKFTTCETEIVKRLVEFCQQRERIGQTLIPRYKEGMSHSLVWQVSHPHGLAKHITVEKLLKKKSEHLRDVCHYYHDLPSCPGCCGGAFEFQLSYDMLNRPKGYVYHSRRGEESGWNVGYFAY